MLTKLCASTSLSDFDELPESERPLLAQQQLDGDVSSEQHPLSSAVGVPFNAAAAAVFSKGKLILIDILCISEYCVLILLFTFTLCYFAHGLLTAD